MFSTAPEPTSTTVKSGKDRFGRDQRVAKTAWVLNPDADGVPQVVVTLTTYHYGDRKMLSSSLTWGTKEPSVPGSVFSVETWGSDHTLLRVHTVPVARYSKKALEAHHAEALDAVETYWDERAEAVFAEAARRSGLVTA